MLTDEIKKSIDESVLCWLATVSIDGSPNVSPKEGFTYDKEGRILIAHIASPQSISNIQNNNSVCLGFINVFTQMGYKIKGAARILKEGNCRYEAQQNKLISVIGEKLPVLSIIEIEPTKIDHIVAPNYILFPKTREKDLIRQALKSYRVSQYATKANESE